MTVDHEPASPLGSGCTDIREQDRVQLIEVGSCEGVTLPVLPVAVDCGVPV